MANTSVSFDINSELKQQADEVFKRLGISSSSAIYMFYSQVVKQQNMPFSVAMEDLSEEKFKIKLSNSLASARAGKGRSAAEVFADLERTFGL